MPSAQPHGGKKQWGAALRKARKRVEHWKKSTDRCERARVEATRMLDLYVKRLAAMAALGEIGTRQASDGKTYPQLRIVYWGGIECGAMSLMCLEIDYGAGERARIGLWAKFRALWDSSALGLGERLRAWRRGRDLGAPSQVDLVWRETRACLRALSEDLALDLSYEPKRQEGALDDKIWRIWVASQGSMLVALNAPDSKRPDEGAGHEPEPSEQEWSALELEVKAMLSGISAGAIGEPSRAPPSESDGSGGANSLKKG